MKERVLITGASGFVGYHLIEAALKEGLEVFAAVRKSSQVAHLEHFKINYTYPDFNDAEALKKDIAANKYDYIIHSAGVTRALSAAAYDSINAGYTHNIALAATESGVAIKKFVLISSLAAVGPLTTLDGIIDEQTTPAPITAYGKSKLLAEEKLKNFTGLDYTILRPTGVYGPRDKDIFIFFKQVKKGIEPYIGKIDQKLSLVYVTDLAKAAISSLHAGSKKTYNLSDGNFYDRYQLGNISKEVLRVKPLKIHLPVNFVKLIALVSEKYSSLSHKAAVLNLEKLNELMAVNWHCDIEQAKADLDYHPEHDLRSGVNETLNWYIANNWL